MRRTTLPVAALAVATVLGLSACGADDGGPAPGSRGGTATETIGCPSVAATPASGATSDPGSTRSTGPSGPGRARVRVGVLLPGSMPGSVTRFRTGSLLTGALEGVGLEPEVWSGPGSQRGYVSIARSMIAEGIRVLVLGPIDPGAGARVERAADRAGIPVVEYGGTVLGGTAGYTVSFDYEQIGRLEAQTMVDCLTSRGVTHPRVILVDGGTDVDHNAVLLDVGAHQVLDPLVTAGTVDLAQETSVPGWRTAGARTAFAQALGLAGDRVDGVLAANDALAGAVIRVLRQRGLDDTVVVGQGDGREGLVDVTSGEQGVTVYTDPEREAEAAARLVRALVAGDDDALAAPPLVEVDDPLSTRRTLKALWVPGRAVTHGDAQQVLSGLSAAGSPARHPTP